ncbi:family 78 glycoside hydrolase catalytic domain [Amycolatopsis pigmentata]|uniref:alpha-L-rhamnosidase n=1 Tax=Amycolatopsis pigmentata TaxID=450801 RepID=A0ABW5FNR1_9PSEU
MWRNEAPRPRRARIAGALALAAVLAAVLAATQAIPAVASAAPSPGPYQAGTASAPDSLRVDGQSSGALVDAANPRFSWAVNDTARGEAQTAYELRVDPVATGPAPRTPGWDSGRVSSAESTGIPYAGPALLSDRTYRWSVRTWNREGRMSPWSAPASFDTGLLAPSDWSAWWLQVGDGALVRGDFDVTKPVARARLYFGAQGIVEPHLDGARVNPAEVLDSSVTDYASRVLYRDFDVTTLLTTGRNTLSFMAGKGQYADHPAFVAQLDITYADGSTSRFGTDPAWKTTAGPVTGDDFYRGETYDARKAIPGWDTVGFDDGSWAAAHAVAPASHQQSLARGKPVTALDATICCGWSPAALTDGIDGSSDASEGYHSAIVSTSDTIKWVQTDLGSAQHVRGIRLFPARPTNDAHGADLIGAGFPVRYQVQTSDDPTFATATTIVDRTGADQANPGIAPVSLDTDVTARYIRVIATNLACTGNGCDFRLAELGVYGPDPAITDSGVTTLRADRTPPTRVLTTLPVVTETRPSPGRRVYDFGQNQTGRVTISATAPAGTTVDIRKGEILDGAGEVSTANISFDPGDPPRQTDHYTFAGTGTETYTPHFRYDGFRYAELTGLPDDATVAVTAEVVHTDVATTGDFHTSNPLLNNIQDAVARTQVNDLETIPMDCPTREKHGWLGDAGDTDQEAMSNYDMESFYTKWFGDIATSANPDGSVPSVAPVNGQVGAWPTDPAWGTAYPQILWDSYTQYGNSQPVVANYARVKAWVDYLGTISDADHIVVNAPTSYGDDWLSTVITPHDYFQTGFYYLDATLLAKMATVVGNSADATRYSSLAGQIAAGFLKRYFDAGTGVFGTGTQLSYAMPLVLGLVPASHEQTTVDRLVADITAHGNHVTTGFVGTTLVYQALGRYGRDDIALALAERTDFPSFGYMLAQGPGTIWEKWVNSTAPDGTSSKDHIGLGGSIGQWFYQRLGGIQPGAAGYRTVTLAPSVVGDLTDVSARQRTVRGVVESSWQRNGTTLTYHAKVPVGTTATIKLPLLGGRGSTVRESGRTIFAGGRPGQPDAGLTVGTATDDTLTMTAGSGDYTFTVMPPGKPFTKTTLSAGATAPVTAGSTGDVNVVVEGRSTAPGTTAIAATAPTGWTATVSPARFPLTPATMATDATVHLAVPADTHGGVYPVTVTTRAPDGTTATTTTDVLVFGKWASGATASASSEHGPNVVNGATRTYIASNAIDGNLTTFWNDDTQNAYPDTLTITAPSAVTLTGAGFASFPDGAPAAFTIQTWNGTQWVTQGDVSGNRQLYRWIPFAGPVTTSQVRIVVTATPDGFSRIAELTP